MSGLFFGSGILIKPPLPRGGNEKGIRSKYILTINSAMIKL
jgi:hypothetical protein